MLGGSFGFGENGGKQSLSYTLAEGEQLDHNTYGMLNNNKIEGFAPVAYVQFNEQRELKYDVTGFEMVTSFLRGTQMYNTTLLTMFSGIMEAVGCLDLYGIPATSVLISTDTVFVKSGGLEQRLICLPMQEATEAPDFISFFKQVLSDASFAPGESTNCRMTLLNYLNRPEPFVLAEFRKLVDKFFYGSYNTRSTQPAGNPQTDRPIVKRPIPTSTPVAPPKSAPKQAAPPPTPAPKQAAQPVAVADKPAASASFAIPGGGGSFAIPGAVSKAQAPKAQTLKSAAKKADESQVDAPSLMHLLMHFNAEELEKYKKAKSGKGGKEKKEKSVPVEIAPPPPATPASNHDFGYTMRLEREDVDAETSGMVLTAAYLIRKSTGERIKIGAAELTIGSEVHNGYVLKNEAVSRRHAKITRSGDEFFVTDLRSLNYTRVNGKLLQPNEPEPLIDGAWIKLANEDFEFHID